MKLSWTNTRVKLGALKPWAQNPKFSSKAQAQRILDSFEKFGQVMTVAISPDNDVYDGHQRLSALLTIHGADYEIDARQSNRPLTDAERKELVIVLHAGAVGSWDWERFANDGWTVDELDAWGMGTNAVKDWKNNINNLETMVEAQKPESVDAEPQIDRAAELLEKWQVKTGDLWQIGEHRLLCGDSTKREDVARVMGGEMAGACVTDSPYGINRDGIENDDPKGLRALFDGVLECMPINDGVVINFQSPRMFPVWLDAVRDAGHKFERALWMYKSNDETFPWRGWIMSSETIILSSIGKAEWVDVHPYSHDCYTYNHEEDLKGLEGIHTTVKPTWIVQDLISRVGGDVFEPFTGKGTTLVACQNLGRKGRGIEISPAYCAVTLESLSEAFPELEIKRLQ